MSLLVRVDPVPEIFMLLANTQKNSPTDKFVLCTITFGADNEHAKSCCAPPNQYKGTLWCKTQAGGAQHSAVPLRWCTT